MQKFNSLGRAAGAAVIGFLACATPVKKSNEAERHISNAALQVNSTERCERLRSYVRESLRDLERPWPNSTVDLSWLGDEMLAECSPIESEVIDALRALLARKMRSVDHDEQAASPPASAQEPAPEAQPSVTCIEAIQNLPTVCGVPLFTKELIERCGNQTRRGVGGLDILDTSIPTVLDLREPGYLISCTSRLDNDKGMNQRDLEIEQQRFLGLGKGWQLVEGWQVNDPPLQYNFKGELNLIKPRHQTNYSLNAECRYEHDLDYLPKECTAEETARLAEALCP